MCVTDSVWTTIHVPSTLFTLHCDPSTPSRHSTAQRTDTPPSKRACSLALVSVFICQRRRRRRGRRVTRNSVRVACSMSVAHVARSGWCRLGGTFRGGSGGGNLTPTFTRCVRASERANVQAPRRQITERRHLRRCGVHPVVFTHRSAGPWTLVVILAASVVAVQFN